MGIIDIFIFRHPAIAISSVSALVCLSVSKTQIIIRFVIYLYRFFPNHFDFSCRSVQLLISFNANRNEFLVFVKLKFHREKNNRMCEARIVRQIRFFPVGLFSEYIYKCVLCICSDFTARED